MFHPIVIKIIIKFLPQNFWARNNSLLLMNLKVRYEVSNHSFVFKACQIRNNWSVMSKYEKLYSLVLLSVRNSDPRASAAFIKNQAIRHHTECNSNCFEMLIFHGLPEKISPMKHYIYIVIYKIIYIIIYKKFNNY